MRENRNEREAAMNGFCCCSQGRKPCHCERDMIGVPWLLAVTVCALFAAAYLVGVSA